MERIESIPMGQLAQPKYVTQSNQWKHYEQLPFKRKDKKKFIVLFSFVERRKSYMFSAAIERFGFKVIELGDHIYEDVAWGKEYGSRAWCSPLYFTSGSLIRNLEKIRKERGLTKAQMVDQYVFIGGGGQCGPCRFGMYPAEYYKALDDAGYHRFRLLTFGSDEQVVTYEKDDAVRFNMYFRINMLLALCIADAIHARDMEVRPYEKNPGDTLKVRTQVEDLLWKAFRSPLYFLKIGPALRKAKKMFDAIPTVEKKIPKIFITGEFFANHAHNAGNYYLRDFCIEQGCEVNPALFAVRVSYDYYRQLLELKRNFQFKNLDSKELMLLQKSITKKKRTYAVTRYTGKRFLKLIGARSVFHDVQHLAKIGEKYYSHLIFGGESNMEIAEAILAAKDYQGFISSKPFGCMPSYGVSDGIQSKIQELYPDLNFLSIEVTGDNEANIKNRVSMLIFKAKQQLKATNSPVG